MSETLEWKAWMQFTIHVWFAIASYADALWARHAIFLPHERGGGILRDEPKERLRRRLGLQVFFLVSPICYHIDPLHKRRLNLNNNTLYILSLVLMFSDKGFHLNVRLRMYN